MITATSVPTSTQAFSRIVRWIVGVAFAMTGLAVFGEQFFKAILLIACALLLIPPTARRIEKGRLIISRWSRILVYVVGFIVMVNAAGYSASNEIKAIHQNEAQQVTTPLSTPTTANKDAAEKELKEVMDLGIKANLVESYEFSERATVVYISSVWYTQTVAFKKDFLAKIAMLKKAVTGYGHFEVRDVHSNEKVAEVTAFSQSLEVYK